MCVRVVVCLRERGREKKRERETIRKRERERTHVCVCESEREREKVRDWTRESLDVLVVPRSWSTSDERCERIFPPKKKKKRKATVSSSRFFEGKRPLADVLSFLVLLVS